MTSTAHKKLTLGQLARQCGLARASLLHYEELGLLIPAGRSPAGYRLYGEHEIERLQTIRRYREAGLALPAIKELLDRRASSSSPMNETGALLEARLLSICQEMERLREQQNILARLLAAPEFQGRPAGKGKDAWIELLRQAGFSEADMLDWHCGFEADDAQGHAAFLRSLGLSEDEVSAIREASRSQRGYV